MLVQEITTTLKTCFINCLKELDPLKYPSQILCMVNEVLFSSRCEDAIKKQQLQQLQKSLKVTELYFKYNNYKLIDALILTYVGKINNIIYIRTLISIITISKNYNF